MNCKILLILFLSSLALANPITIDSYEHEFIFTRYCVFALQGKIKTAVYDHTQYYQARVYAAEQREVWPWFLKNWLGGPNGVLDLTFFNEFAKVYQPWETKEEEHIREACEVLGISKMQWQDWLANGQLRTESEIQAEKNAAELKQVAGAVAQISQIKFYLSPDGKWHTEPNCIDNVNSITINPFDVMRIPSVTKCDRCK